VGLVKPAGLFAIAIMVFWVSISIIS